MFEKNALLKEQLAQIAEIQEVRKKTVIKILTDFQESDAVQGKKKEKSVFKANQL